jgi:hypothetical protein
MIKEALFKQTWWVSLAVVLAGLQIVIAIGIGLDSEASATERLVFFSVWGASAALAVLGTQQRLAHRRRGDAMIAVGVVPAVAIGIIAFWFPPLWLSTAGGLLVIWSSIRDAVAPVDVVAT